ncbi:DNA polymerase III subunit alpha [compost metagenome]
MKNIDYVKRAKELGHTTLSTCEHGYAGNVFESYDLAKEHGLKMIFGVEYYYVNNRFEKDKTNTHLMILARTNSGKKAMTKLITESNKTGYFYKPRIDKELLLSLDPDDVLITSTCVMSYIGKCEDYEENFIVPLMNHFGKNFLLEIHDNTHIMQVNYNKKILELHNKYNIPLIHACDSHYIYENQHKDRTQFLNGKNIYYEEEDGFILDYPDSDTIFTRYAEQGVFDYKQVESSLKNTLLLDDFEDIKMDKSSIKMPTIYPGLTHKEKVDKLKSIVTKEWKKDMTHIPRSDYPKYIDGMRFEMDIVESTNMEDYFLLNYEIIKRAKEKGGILTRTGRGSGPSFYLNKLLGFTEIDRLDAPVTLYPTRFMSKSRILETKSLPDIDFNTASPEPFIEAAKEILGEDNIYYMVAYGKMKESEAFRNYCRAINLHMDEYNEVGKNLELYKNDSKWGEIIKESEKFIDVIDSVSPHPCAFILLNEPVSEELGVIRVGNQKNINHCALIDSGTSDQWKYLKNDFLTVSVWEIISDTYKMIGIPIHDIRELSKLVENDEKVWKLYENGLTATLNQAGTDSGTPQAMQYKPKSIRELSAWVAAIRPSFASMKSVFLNREPFSYKIKEFDDILRESDNFVLYQENIMSALVFAEFPEDETYGLLKAIAKKKPGIIEPIQDRFIDGFVKKTGSEENAHKVWKIIEDSVQYGFNSSHSLSVALDSVYGAYLKANYPLQYYTVVLNKYVDDTTMTSKIMKELPHFNIRVSPISFGKSGGKYTPDNKTNTIYKGLESIKYLNAATAEELLELSKNTYDSFVDLLVDITQKTSVNSRQLDILIRLNFFSMYGNSGLLIAIYNEFSNGKSQYKKTYVEKTKIKRIDELNQLEKEIRETNSTPDIPPNEAVMFMREMLGYADITYPNVDSAWCVVTDLDTKYSPKLTLYSLKKGEERMFKMDKKTFKPKDKSLQINKGDLIKITEFKKKYRQVPDGSGGFKATDQMECWITGYIKYTEKGNLHGH